MPGNYFMIFGRDAKRYRGFARYRIIGLLLGIGFTVVVFYLFKKDPAPPAKNGAIPFVDKAPGATQELLIRNSAGMQLLVETENNQPSLGVV